MNMSEINDKGIVYLIPTPIGNMGDMTQRALECLENSELIACEDTRVSGRLLAHFGLKKKLLSYHDFNEMQRLPRLLEILNAGSNIAVITDAGSPGLSDPAYRIIRAAIENDIKISPLPGANALVPAISGSGLPMDRFFFEGFLPNKSGSRKNRLKKLIELEHTLVFYESPHRIEKTLADTLEILGDRRACIAREISKIYEEFIRGTISELIDIAQKRKLKGEMALVVEGAPAKKASKNKSYGKKRDDE